MCVAHDEVQEVALWVILVWHVRVAFGAPRQRTSRKSGIDNPHLHTLNPHISLLLEDLTQLNPHRKVHTADTAEQYC